MRRRQQSEQTRLKIEKRRAEQKLRERQREEGLEPFPTATIANAKSEWTTVDEEKQARQQAIEEQFRVYRSVLPTLLKRFQENLKLLFPELDSVPHQDTINRLLARIQVDQIQDALIELLHHFIRNKKF